MTNDTAILLLLADLNRDRQALIAQRDALKDRVAALEQAFAETTQSDDATQP